MKFFVKRYQFVFVSTYLGLENYYVFPMTICRKNLKRKDRKYSVVVPKPNEKKGKLMDEKYLAIEFTCFGRISNFCRMSAMIRWCYRR